MQTLYWGLQVCIAEALNPAWAWNHLECFWEFLMLGLSTDQIRVSEWGDGGLGTNIFWKPELRAALHDLLAVSLSEVPFITVSFITTFLPHWPSFFSSPDKLMLTSGHLHWLLIWSGMLDLQVFSWLAPLALQILPSQRVLLTLWLFYLKLFLPLFPPL